MKRFYINKIMYVKGTTKFLCIQIVTNDWIQIIYVFEPETKQNKKKIQARTPDRISLTCGIQYSYEFSWVNKSVICLNLQFSWISRRVFLKHPKWLELSERRTVLLEFSYDDTMSYCFTQFRNIFFVWRFKWCCGKINLLLHNLI